VVITIAKSWIANFREQCASLKQTAGVVENIDTTSRQLKEALESSKTIIVTTLQKFPVIVKQIGELAESGCSDRG